MCDLYVRDDDDVVVCCSVMVRRKKKMSWMVLMLLCLLGPTEHFGKTSHLNLKLLTNARLITVEIRAGPSLHGALR